MPGWILDRLFALGDQPTPRFAFQGTVNWMHALALIVASDSFSDEQLRSFYTNVQRRTVNIEADTLVFENTLMAFHNWVSLRSLTQNVDHSYDICRSAIVAWYYSIYFSASAMVAAASGASSETHAGTAKLWQIDIVNNELLVSPFSLNLTTLVSSQVDVEIEQYRANNRYDLNTFAATQEQAFGGVISYLNGTADYEKWRVEERVKLSREFRELGVDNFRTRAARELRDTQLSRGYVNFLVQAFRYRGKANYRDSLFLSYGDDNNALVSGLCSDLSIVSEKFIRMSAFYLSRRIERGAWENFVSDLELRSRLSQTPDILRIQP